MMIARRTAQVVGRNARFFSVSVSDVDWGFLRGRLVSEDMKAAITNREEELTRRLRAARSVGDPEEIDWAHYAEALPNVDVDSLKADFESFVEDIPDLPFDEEEYRSKFTESETNMTKLREFFRNRIAELEASKNEMDRHKLKEQTTVDELFLRFPHAHEQETMNMYRMQVFATADEAESKGPSGDEKTVQLAVELAKRTGFPAEDFLLDEEAHLTEAVKEAAQVDPEEAAEQKKSDDELDYYFYQLNNVEDGEHIAEEAGGPELREQFVQWKAKKQEEWLESFKHH